MLSCPHCRRALAAHALSHGAAWSCAGCGGTAVSGGLLRALIDRDLALALRAGVRAARGHEELPGCPSCRREMGRADTTSSELGIEVEHCPSCDLWWLDRGEAERAVASAAAGTPGSLVQTGPRLGARREQVLASASRARTALERRSSREASRGRELELRLPSSGTKILLTLLGMPAEEDAPRALALPWVTWTLAALTVAISLLALLGDLQLFEALALVPAKGAGPLGLHLLSYFLLHGSLLHLVTNLYFLVVFGDNVEDLLKPARYAALLVFATALSALAHAGLDPRSEVPLVGASGGISAIVVYYGLALPRVKLSVFVLLFWVRISALWALLGWIGLQLTGIFDQLDGSTDVSFAGHLGGALVGLVAWLLWRPSAANRAEATLPRPRY